VRNGLAVCVMLRPTQCHLMDVLMQSQVAAAAAAVVIINKHIDTELPILYKVTTVHCAS
jgi:hypothetical protein